MFQPFKGFRFLFVNSIGFVSTVAADDANAEVIRDDRVGDRLQEAAGAGAVGADAVLEPGERPALEQREVGEQAGGRERRRIVLGDWYEQGSVLRVDAGGFRLDALPAG